MQISYLGIMLLMVVSPLPPEVFIPLAGFMAAQGKLHLVYVVLSAVAGFLVSILPWYMVGRILGRRGCHRLIEQKMGHQKMGFLALSPMKLQKANRWFRRHGGQALLISLMLPGLRNMMAVPAGMSGMPPLTFLLYVILGGAVWLSVLTCAGYLLGDRYELISAYFSSSTTLFLLIVGIVALSIWGIRLYLRRKATL